MAVRFTPKIEKAINFASTKHLGQKRKADLLPFVVHPISVAWIVSEYTKDENVVVAALLHDTLEDVPGFKAEEISKEFGLRVLKIVLEVTEIKTKERHDSLSSWEKRKYEYLINLKTASQDALLVCAADKIHNLGAMINIYQRDGKKIWKRFNAPPSITGKYYESVLELLKQRLHSSIVKELTKLYKQAQKIKIFE